MFEVRQVTLLQCKWCSFTLRAKTEAKGQNGKHGNMGPHANHDAKNIQ
jgi:hypothetical protein